MNDENEALKENIKWIEGNIEEIKKVAKKNDTAYKNDIDI